MAGNEVLVEVPIAAPVDTVWAALREPDLLASWFGWDAPTLAEEIDFIFNTHATPDAAARRLDFGAWEGIAYSFVLEPRAEGTVLRLLWRETPEGWQRDAYDEVVEGWISFVAQLRLLLDRHPGARRRTLYHSGALRPGAPPLTEALGIAGLRDKPDGAEFALELPTGETVAGIVWHRSAHQIGLNVLEYGEGLLIVLDRPAGEGRPHGGGAVLITTFGLDEAAFAELEARWSAWCGTMLDA